MHHIHGERSTRTLMALCADIGVPAHGVERREVMVHPGNGLGTMALHTGDAPPGGVPIVSSLLLVTALTPLMPIIRHPGMSVRLIARGLAPAAHSDNSFRCIPLSEWAAPTRFDLIFFIVARAHLTKLVPIRASDLFLGGTRPRQEDTHQEQSYEYCCTLHDSPYL